MNSFDFEVAKFRWYEPYFEKSSYQKSSVEQGHGVSEVS